MAERVFPTEEQVWDAITAAQGRVYTTARGLDFTYAIRGGEMFVDRKEKSITKASILAAYRQVIALEGNVSGPKKLGTFGASYLYPLFIELGYITSTEKTERRRGGRSHGGSSQAGLPRQRFGQT